EASELQAQELRRRDAAGHVREPALYRLRLVERAAEQLARLRVCDQLLQARLRRADDTPGDAVARLCEAGQRPPQSLHSGQHVLLRHTHVVEEERRRDGSAQRELAL